MSLRQLAYSFKNITTNTTTDVKDGPGVLYRLVFNKPVSGSTVTVYDEVSGGTTLHIGIVTNTTDVKPYVHEFNVKFKNGLQIVTSGSDDITVVYT